MRRILSFLVIVLLSGLMACQDQSGQPNPDEMQFAATGDSVALNLAAQVLETNGGQKAWTDSRYIAWTFFGRRRLVWDKWGQEVRIHYTDGSMDMSLHIPDTTGMVWKNGVAMTEPDSLDKYLNQAYRTWINDSYWVFMPYKLKDSGVTLRYVGEGQMADGRAADILELTFANVGVTPENKYHVAIAKDTHLVEEWSFFEKFSDEKPAFTTPWSNWKKYGNILLSDDRGKAKHTDLHVYETLPESVFTDPAPWP